MNKPFILLIECRAPFECEDKKANLFIRIKSDESTFHGNYSSCTLMTKAALKKCKYAELFNPAKESK